MISGFFLTRLRSPLILKGLYLEESQRGNIFKCISLVPRKQTFSNIWPMSYIYVSSSLDLNKHCAANVVVTCHRWLLSSRNMASAIH
jgi:hypothetical protein